jgi:cullin-associated NEDD8-dissociated protein 1
VQLDTCLSRIDLHAFLERVLKGLSDESDEIKVICHMMLFRMSQIAPAATSQRLDDAAESLAVTMKGVVVNKDTVKQDLERASELQRSALRAIAALSKITTPGQAIKFDGVVEQVQRGQYSNEFRDLTA